MGGKPQSFTVEEIRVLRAALKKYADDKGLSQAELGRLLGISQQNAGRLISATPVGMPIPGMGRPTANRLVNLLGFSDAESFLLAAGVASSMKEIPKGNPWRDRDAAVAIARQLGVHEAAITAVLGRFTSDNDRRHRAIWWVTKFGQEETELAAERALVRPEAAPESSPALKDGVRPKKRKKRSG